MKEVTIKFTMDGPEDESSLRRFMAGEDAIFVLHDYSEKLRSLLKYEEDDTLGAGLSLAREAFHGILEHYDLNLDALLR